MTVAALGRSASMVNSAPHAPARDGVRLVRGGAGPFFSVGKASAGTVPLMGMGSAISCGLAPRREARHGVAVVSGETVR